MKIPKALKNRWRAIPILGLAQILSWGAIYYTPVLIVPLIVFDTPNNRWVQVGVVSNGLGCARANYPGIYSRLSFLLNFVNAAIGLPVIMHARATESR
mgnify:CR=1 FL=1